MSDYKIQMTRYDHKFYNSKFVINKELTKVKSVIAGTSISREVVCNLCLFLGNYDNILNSLKNLDRFEKKHFVQIRIYKKNEIIYAGKIRKCKGMQPA